MTREVVQVVGIEENSRKLCSIGRKIQEKGDKQTSMRALIRSGR